MAGKIVVTGAAGFIGSVLVGELNDSGYQQLVLVDDFSRADKENNWKDKKYITTIDREAFEEWLQAYGADVDFVFHLGARTDTTEFDMDVFNHLNLDYTRRIWEVCVQHQIPLLYASSAATYGLGEQGYKDDHTQVDALQPLNPYGWSKQHFDQWALRQENTPPWWAGIKFFNVYGPNEYHKGRMASVVLHAFRQIQETGQVKLFRSHNPEYKDGAQLRDFIYVLDAVDALIWLMKAKPACGLYNLGTGHAGTFLELARSTFAALEKPEAISFIDTPKDIRDKYQYFTEADMHKLRAAGYTGTFRPLREGVRHYVQQFLLPGNYR